MKSSGIKRSDLDFSPINAVALTRALVVVILGGVIAGFHAGVMPALLPGLREQYQLSLAQAGWLFSMFQLAVGLLGVVGGVLSDRLGRARLPVLGGGLLMLGDLLCLMSTQQSSLFFGRALASLGFMCVVLPAPSLLLRFVRPSRQGLILGIYGAYMPLGMGMGLFIAPLLISSQVDSGGLGTLGAKAVWWTCLALAALVSFSYCYWVLPLVPRKEPTQHSGWHESRAAISQTARSLGPWLLAIGFGLYAGQWMSVMNFLPTFYREQNMSLSAAGMLTALAVMVNSIGPIAAGIALHKGVQRKTLIWLGSAAMLLGAMLVYVWVDGPFLWRYIALLMFSILGGLIPGTLFASTGAYSVQSNWVPVTTGMMQQGSACGQFLAAPLMGALVAYSGTWTSAAWMCAVMAVLVMLVGWKIGDLDAALAASR